MKSYRNITIPQQLKETAQRFPERTAVSYPGRRLTYAELDEFSDRTAQAFLSCGIKKGSHVALFSANVPELVLIFHALWKIGAVVIPLCTAYSAQEQQYALQRSDAEHLILIGRPVNGAFSVPREQLGSIRMYAFREPDDLIDFMTAKERVSVAVDTAEDDDLYYERETFPELEQAKAQVQPDDPDMILFTSGSTGGAKPVISTNKARINLAQTHADYLEAAKNDVFCAALPLYHCFALTGVMLAALCSGAELAFPRDRHSENVARCIEKRRCTVLSAVPTFYSALIRRKNEDGADLSSLRTGMIGGSPYSSEFFKKVCRELDMTLLPSIGMTEATAGYTSGKLSDPLELRAASLGEVFPEVQCVIADAEGNELPEGKPGRIMLKGPSVIGRYYSGYAPDCLESVRMKDGRVESGWMDTGDIGSLDENGYLFFKGRSKEIIIRSGENISPTEIENALAGIPGIRDIKAVGVPDPHRIEEICVCAVADEPSQDLEEAIRQTAAEKLSSYMQPRYVVFLDSLPLRSSGKPDLQKLKETAAKLCGII